MRINNKELYTQLEKLASSYTKDPLNVSSEQLDTNRSLVFLNVRDNVPFYTFFMNNLQKSEVLIFTPAIEKRCTKLTEVKRALMPLNVLSNGDMPMRKVMELLE